MLLTNNYTFTSCVYIFKYSFFIYLFMVELLNFVASIIWCCDKIILIVLDRVCFVLISFISFP
jgi:hypothetical protein